MFCTECGNEIDNDKSFCTQCGAKLPSIKSDKNVNTNIEKTFNQEVLKDENQDIDSENIEQSKTLPDVTETSNNSMTKNTDKEDNNSDTPKPLNKTVRFIIVSSIIIITILLLGLILLSYKRDSSPVETKFKITKGFFSHKYYFADNVYEGTISFENLLINQGNYLQEVSKYRSDKMFVVKGSFQWNDSEINYKPKGKKTEIHWILLNIEDSYYTFYNPENGKDAKDEYIKLEIFKDNK